MGTVTQPTRVVDLVYYEETGISVADFTDGTGGATKGVYVLKFALPVGFFVERTQLFDVVGFAGDTSAVITVGDGSDVDRYNTGTPSVFTTISRLDLGIASGTRFIATENYPTLTITTGADFTTTVTDGNGLLSIRIYGWKV
jgi:hypothetical protein